MIISDAQSIAVLIAAVTTGIVTLGTFAMQVLNFRAGRKRDVKLSDVHDLVNGQSKALAKAIGVEAFSAGHAEGIATERNDPHANPLGKKR